MNNTDKCPHRGADLIDGLTNQWLCGSWLHVESGAGRNTDFCRERAARQKAEAEVAKVRIERCRYRELLDEERKITEAQKRNIDVMHARAETAEAELAKERAAHAETRKELVARMRCATDARAELMEARRMVAERDHSLTETRRMLEEAEKALDYYRSAFLRQRPNWLPARVLVTKEVRADYPVADAYEPIHAGEVECRSNLLGAVSVVNRNGVEIGLRPSEFQVIAWRRAEKGGAGE